MDLMMSSLAILRLTFLVMIKINMSLQQQCKPIVSSQIGYALVDKEYKSSSTKDYPACMMSCHKDEKCMSVNFHLVTRTCDLNAQTRESKPTYYKERQNSIYSTNMAFRTPGPEPEPLKGLKERPGKSCLDILVSGDSNGTGVYWIDPFNTGTPIQAYCDMTTDGGGWTTVRKTILPTKEQPPLPETVNAYQAIASYDRKDKWIIPTSDAMWEILQKMGFHQIHFYCHKKIVGRVVSIVTRNNTAGQQVVKYFTTPGQATFYPTACGSFDNLPEDTSILAQKCEQWGTGKPKGATLSLADRWGCQNYHRSARLGTLPFQMDIPPKYFYGSAFLDSGQQGYCDDAYPTPELYSVNDTWVISVR